MLLQASTAVFVNLQVNPLTLYFFGVEKRLQYDLLSNFSAPMYNVDDYIKCQLKVFSDIHESVRNKLQATIAAICE